MDVYLLRHGEAGSPRQQHDEQRPLTADGVKQLERQAAALRGWGVRIDLLLSSPYVRARQTADIIARAYQMPVSEDPRLAAGCTASAALAVLHDHAALKHIWLTGHEPDLSEICAALTGGGRVRMVKGGLARIQLDSLQPAHGELIWYLTPALMGATLSD